MTTSAAVPIDDFQTRLTRTWPITCLGTDVGLVHANDSVEFSFDGSKVTMSINGVLQNTPISQEYPGDHMTTVHPLLEIGQTAPFAALSGDPNVPESFLRDVLTTFEHQTLLVLATNGAIYAVYAFVVMPSLIHPKHDILVLEIVEIQKGNGVSDNSVHGGPPT